MRVVQRSMACFSPEYGFAMIEVETLLPVQHRETFAPHVLQHDHVAPGQITFRNTAERFGRPFELLKRRDYVNIMRVSRPAEEKNGKVTGKTTPRRVGTARHADLVFHQCRVRFHVERHLVVEQHFGLVRAPRLLVVRQTLVDQRSRPSVVTVQLDPVQHGRVIVASLRPQFGLQNNDTA